MSIDVVYLHTFSSKKPAKNVIKKWKNSFAPKSFLRESLCVLLSRKKELQNVIITLNELLQVVLTRHDISWQLIVFKKRIWREYRVLETKKTIYWCALYFLYNTYFEVTFEIFVKLLKKSQYMYIVNDILKLFSSLHLPRNVHYITYWTKMAKRFLIFLFLWIIGYSSMKKITQLGWPFFILLEIVKNDFVIVISFHYLVWQIGYIPVRKKTFCKVPLDHYSN